MWFFVVEEWNLPERLPGQFNRFVAWQKPQIFSAVRHLTARRLDQEIRCVIVRRQCVLRRSNRDITFAPALHERSLPIISGQGVYFRTGREHSHRILDRQLIEVIVQTAFVGKLLYRRSLMSFAPLYASSAFCLPCPTLPSRSAASALMPINIALAHTRLMRRKLMLGSPSGFDINNGRAAGVFIGGYIQVYQLILWSETRARYWRRLPSCLHSTCRYQRHSSFPFVPPSEVRQILFQSSPGIATATLRAPSRIRLFFGSFAVTLKFRVVHSDPVAIRFAFMFRFHA